MCITALTASLTSSADSLSCDLGFYAWTRRGCRELATWSGQSRQGKMLPPPSPFVAIIYASCFFCHKVMAANDVRVAAGAVWTLVSWALACSPSLNSPRSNLQTAAEFWQILPQCFLPLGDTFFIYFSSPPLWYSLHGALAPQAIVSSVLRPCLKNQMDLQGLLSTPSLFSGLMNVAQSSISTLLFLHHPILYSDLVILLPKDSCYCCPGFNLSYHDFHT